MNIRLAQLVVTKSVEENKKKILDVIQSSQKGEWVVFPEGMLSGYYPEEANYLASLHWEEIESATHKIIELTKEKGVKSIFGTALFDNGVWYNSAIFVHADGEKDVYKKVNLATLDRKCFKAGDALETFVSDEVRFGIQLCRDNVFPEQWKVLKHLGAQVVFHVNNAIKEIDTNRMPLLTARAFENQFFVVSANNAAKPQTLPSLAILEIFFFNLNLNESR